jgi:diguanylate cyclase (GGDEF)-like protein
MILLMFGLALGVLPFVAWMDYRDGLYMSAMVEIVAAVTLFSLGLLAARMGFERARRVTLLVMFALVALGSIEKLGSTANFAWFTVMPFLYISIGGMRFGGALALGHYIFVALSSWYLQQQLDGGMDAWIQISVAYLTASCLALSYEHVQRQLRRRLRTMAEHDVLTGLLNRRGMERRLKELSSFLTRHNMVVTMALLDVDHFKRVNDEHGHDVGDRVLKELSAELGRVFRKSDYLARWGGEEFLVALTRTDLHQAVAVLDRLRAEVADTEALSVNVSLSIGVAEWRPGMPLGAALKQADLALYEAKNGGRNKVMAAGSTGRSVRPGLISHGGPVPV